MAKQGLDLFKDLRVWKRQDVRAPNKPLLLLFALGRLQRGEPRLMRFADVEEAIDDLLRRFGPPRRSVHATYPFWRLQNDGIWEVASPHGLRSRRGNTDPPATELRKAEGGFLPEVANRLSQRPSELIEVANQILADHFPVSLHADIANSVGLGLDAIRSQERDPAFRRNVLNCYGHRCAVCGFHVLLDGLSVSLEAAHVRWHCYGGPSSLDNGLCLCPTHHKALDLGLWSISSERRILISSRANGAKEFVAFIGRFDRKMLRAPNSPDARVRQTYSGWHQAQVFRGPPTKG